MTQANGAVSQFQIGDRITFALQSGMTETGKIVGRDWSFSTLLAYTVRTAKGLNYHVNANDFQAGHSF